MTDNEIIKALEQSSNYDCELCEDKDEDCQYLCEGFMADSILNLINRQKAEFEDAKTKAIREFADKFKSTLKNLEANSPNKTYQTAMQDMLDYYVPTIIDDLVKEMTEATDETPH